MSTTPVADPITSATQGNRFDYYGPPNVAAAGAEKATLFSTLASGEVATPGATIKANFPKIHLAPFGTKKRLAPRRVVSRLQAVLAAIECGYGKRGQWASSMALDPAACRHLSRYMLARLELAATYVERNASRAYYPRGFSRVLEKSETGMLAFTLGSMGTYLAARQWLAAGGVSMSAFLHYDIWSKAQISKSSAGTNGKQPDFLVADSAGNWHVFESKGGRFANRWSRLAEGLLQLRAVTKVGWAGKLLVEPKSKACIHTSIDPGEPLHVMFVDPVDSSEAGEGAGNYSVLESMSKLMVMLETIDLFDVLTARNSGGDVKVTSEWATGVSTAFGGLQLRMPSALLEQAAQARRYVNLLLWTREQFELGWRRGVEPDGEAFAEALISDVVSKGWLGQDKAARSMVWYLHAQQVLIDTKRPADIMLNLSSQLAPASVSGELAYVQGLQDGAPEDSDVLMTTGGLHISALPRNRRVDGEPRG